MHFCVLVCCFIDKEAVTLVTQNRGGQLFMTCAMTGHRFIVFVPFVLRNLCLWIAFSTDVVPDKATKTVRLATQ